MDPNSTQPVRVRNARDTDAKAVVELLSSEHHLEIAFDPAEFVVAEIGNEIVGCGRLKGLSPDAYEIASVVVKETARRHRVGATTVRALLERAHGTVYALALAPEFFKAQGFRPIPNVPDLLIGKATSVCASSGFIPMAFQRHT